MATFVYRTVIRFNSATKQSVHHNGRFISSTKTQPTTQALPGDGNLYPAISPCSCGHFVTFHVGERSIRGLSKARFTPVTTEKKRHAPSFAPPLRWFPAVFCSQVWWGVEGRDHYHMPPLRELEFDTYWSWVLFKKMSVWYSLWFRINRKPGLLIEKTDVIPMASWRQVPNMRLIVMLSYHVPRDPITFFEW